MNRNDYYETIEYREEPKEIMAVRKIMDEKIRYIKAEIWDHERLLGDKNTRPTAEEILLYKELQLELVELSNCDQSLRRIGQGIDRIIDSAKERAQEKAAPLKMVTN